MNSVQQLNTLIERFNAENPFSLVLNVQELKYKEEPQNINDFMLVVNDTNGKLITDVHMGRRKSLRYSVTLENVIEVSCVIKTIEKLRKEILGE
jgi:hypothetical protein